MKNQLDCEGSLPVRNQVNFGKPLDSTSGLSCQPYMLLLVGHPTLERLHRPVSLCNQLPAQ